MTIIKEYRNYPREEKIALKAICEHCDHVWFPYENEIQTLPHESVLKCPKCEKKTEMFWPDDKMNKEMLYKKHVLGNEIKIKQAQKTIEVLKTTRDEWKNRYEQESEKNTTPTKVIDRLSEKLEQLQVEVDDGDKNPLSS